MRTPPKEGDNTRFLVQAAKPPLKGRTPEPVPSMPRLEMILFTSQAVHSLSTGPVLPSDEHQIVKTVMLATAVDESAVPPGSSSRWH